MFKILNPDDSSIHPFKVYKQFTVTNLDSGSGVYGLEGLSGSAFNFISSSAESQSFGTYNSLSSSFGIEPYSQGTFYKLPLFFSIQNLYYKKPDVGNFTFSSYHTFGGNNTSKEYRKIFNHVNVIAVPQNLFGERIKPGSIKLTDNSTATTYDIRDDGDGNLYDFAYSSSFASYKSESFSNTSSLEVGTESGSVIGNVFYSHGILTITDTGSYSRVGIGTGSNGFELNFKSTKTIYEYQYTCMADPGEFNSTTNISVSHERSGSATIKESVPDTYRFLPPGDNPSYGTGSFNLFYNATDTYITGIMEGEQIHSEFAPYITTVGLYNDNNQLLAIGKLSKPLKNDPELKLGIVVRFDT